ncbi:hypothetical protein Sste5346_001718 [Sporothrix stenoceras]|uniref:Zn(2)-C6 fungal-type domain-containing protein n=1 Tax=Sporothrix stenoceras TaxID=5173 RepID=A0ABR3ZPD7_9PEZI
MVGPIKTRLACDRCHGQKLRCPKQSGSRVCTRCERAGVACIFSPIGKTSGAFQNGSSNGMSPIDTGFPAAELFGGTSDGVNLNNDDWSRPYASGNAGSNGSNGTPGLNFDELIQMASIDAPIFTSDTANLFAGMSPEMTSGMTPETTAPTAVNSANLASSTATPKDTTNTATSTTLTHRLAKLVVDTDLLYEALPNESTMHVPLEAGSSDGGERNGESDGATPDGDAQLPFLAFLDRPHYSQDKFAKKEFLERVFDITQRLSTAYADADAAPKKTKNAANGTRNGREAEEACDADNCLHTVDLPGNLSSLEAAFLESGVSAKKPHSTGNDIDLTVVSLLVAAHTRLLDVLVRIVHGIFACYRLRVATSTLDDAEMQLPDLMIGGSFVPPKGSAALVHAFLLRHLLDSLQTGVELYWAKLKEVDDSESSEKSLANRERHIAALQFGVLKERHDATLHHLVAVGTDLASTGLIK